jgi:hypothetical protein
VREAQHNGGTTITGSMSLSQATQIQNMHQTKTMFIIERERCERYSSHSFLGATVTVGPSSIQKKPIVSTIGGDQIIENSVH